MIKCISIFCVLIIIIGPAACNKENKIDLTEIQGVWELRKVSGMITINHLPGNGHTIQFTGTRFERKENQQVVQSGEFRIVKDTNPGQSTCLIIPPGQYNNRIIYNNNITGPKTFFELSDNRLVFVSGCFAVDAGSTIEYERQ
jgi:hypothetical protein